MSPSPAPSEAPASNPGGQGLAIGLLVLLIATPSVVFGIVDATVEVDCPEDGSDCDVGDVLAAPFAAGLTVLVEGVLIILGLVVWGTARLGRRIVRHRRAGRAGGPSNVQ